MPQEFKVKNGLIVDQGGANITGSSAISGALSIASSGSSLFTVDGAAGRLFSVDDSLSGSLFSVNTIAGLPVMEAFSDNTVRIGQYGRRGLYVSQSSVGIGKETALNASLDVSGSATVSGSLRVSLEPSASSTFRISSGSNTLLNVNSPGRLWLGNGTFVDAGYQADIQGSTRIIGSITVGSTVASQLISTNAYSIFYLGANISDGYLFMTSRSGSIAIGSGDGVTGGPAEQLTNIYYANSGNVFIGHAAVGSGNNYNSVIIGYRAGKFANINNIGNVILGSEALGFATGGDVNYNVAIGNQASYRMGLGGWIQNSVAVGYQANYSGSGNSVMLGNQAGFSELNRNRLYIANTNTTSPLIGGDFFSGSVGINMRISDISASFHIKGTGATSASNALIVDNSNLTDLLRISNNGQQFVTSPIMTLTSSNAGYLISQSLVHSGSIPFTRLTGVNITPSFTNTTSSQTQTALRVSALFTGSASGSNTNNVIVDFGTQTSGSMFIIDDVVSGSVYTVNDFFGLPVLEVTSDAQVNMYDYPYAVFNKSASYVSLGLPSTFAVDSAVYLRADTVMDEGFGFTNRVSQGNGTTLNDSTASLYTFTFTTNTGSAYVNAVVTGYDSASRATISGEIKSTIKCLSGVASIIGNNFRYVNSENAGVNIDLTVSSNTFSVRAYGTGSRTYVWAATVTTQVI